LGKNNIIIDVLVNNAGIKVPTLGLVGLIYYVFQLRDGFIRPVKRGSHALLTPHKIRIITAVSRTILKPSFSFMMIIFHGSKDFGDLMSSR
jgi:hypothetical protein